MIKTNRLPKEYQEVEYIKADGNSYIDTNLALGSKFKIDVNFMTSQITLSEQPIVSTWSGYSTNYWNLFVNGNGRLVCYVKAHKIAYNSSLTTDEMVNATITRTDDNFKITTNNSSLEFQDSTLVENNTSVKIFARGDLNSKSSVISISKLKIYENSVLVRNYVPCYRKSDNVIGMYDLVNNQFYTNDGTGNFTKGNDVQVNVKSIKVHKNNNVNDVMYIKTKVNNSMVKVYDQLPSEYQRVNYIESDGTQYIDTNYIINSNTNKFQIVCQMCNVNNSFNCMFGYEIGGSNRFFARYNQNATTYVATYTPSASSHLITALNKNNIIFDLKNNKMYKNGIEENITISVNTSGANIYIFGLNYNNTFVANNRASMKLFEFKIFENDVVVKNLIPCYRKSDSEIGLYDLVNNVFYTNAEAGTFNKGSNI